MKLLNVGNNAKTVKGDGRGYLTGVLYLAPARLSGWEVCPMRSKGCSEACLNTAGRGAMTSVQKARIAKTAWLFSDRYGFMLQLGKDIDALVSKARRLGMIPVVRLNGTSDIAWERMRYLGMANIMAMFPNVQFYDYTKVPRRLREALQGTDWPRNYHLTFSLAEDNDEAAGQVLAMGGTVAAVFHKAPEEYMGRRVVDGDRDDLRFLDPAGVVVGLTAKGKAKKDQSGFVRAA